MPTPEELAKAKAVAAEIEKQFAMKDHGTNLQTARYILLIVGIFNVLSVLWYTFGPTRYTEILYVNGSIAAIFIALYFTSKSNPIVSMSAGLGIYLLIHLTVLAVSGEAFLQGSLWKIMTIVLLGIGLAAAIKMKKNADTSNILDSEEDKDLV